MIITTKDYQIELSIEELKALLPSSSGIVCSPALPPRSSEEVIANKPPIERNLGSGRYPHKSEVSEEKKKIIKNTFTLYPERSIRSVAKELGISKNKVRYWRDQTVESPDG